jgi:hypothetical protein
VHAGENNDLSRFDDIEQQIWEPAKNRSSDAKANDGTSLRTGNDQRNGSVDRAEKL